MIHAHTANQGDLCAMSEIDLRCFEYPLSYLDLKEFLKSSECFCVIAADKSNHIVGYAIFKAAKVSNELEIVRLSVLPKYRGLGAGKELLRAGRDYAITANLDKMFIIVPEVLCDPRKLDDVSKWLNFQDFKATQIIKDSFIMYGDNVPGYKFVRAVDVT